MIRDNFLIDLDSVFDTRIAVINSIYGTKYSDVLYKDELYDSRLDDLFNKNEGMEDFDLALYQKRYAARTASDLEHGAAATRISGALNCHATKLKISAGRLDYVPRPIITINVYPYKFDKIFIEDNLLPAMEFLFHQFEEVKIVNLPLMLLTPSYLKANHSDVVMYDFEPWLKVQAEALRKRPIPSVKFTVPKKAIVPDENNIVSSGSAPATIKTLLAQVLNVDFEPLEAFSLDIENLILAKNNEPD